MKYYLIAGEASGDLHASRLMRSLKEKDPEAEFRFFGGDLMAAEGGMLVKHYRELAYMGFIPVLMHLRTILRNMKMCQEDIREWQPDAVILVDYPGFNLRIAKYVHLQLPAKIYYYISPKIWAWKEHRIKAIKRDVDELFSILPFEVDFFEKKHHFPIHYVGNPTAQEVREFCRTVEMSNDDFLRHNVLPQDGSIIAVLCGSRKQEIKDNLPAMLEAVKPFADQYKVVIAGAPGIEYEYYDQFVKGHKVEVLFPGWTYHLLYNAKAALVTSGTATLEACMFNVPQVVCYYTPVKQCVGMLRRLVLKVKYVSLVNLIADREVVPELVAESFSVRNIRNELEKILSGCKRKRMLDGYKEVHRRLGESNAPDRAAEIMVELLKQR